MNHRIKELRKKLGLNQKEFSEKIGIMQTSLSHIEIGKNRLTEQNIKMICLTFGVNEDWLRYGTGEMLNDEETLPEDERKLLDYFRKLTPRARTLFIEYAEKLLSDEQALRGEYPVINDVD